MIDQTDLLISVHNYLLNIRLKCLLKTLDFALSFFIIVQRYIYSSSLRASLCIAMLDHMLLCVIVCYSALQGVIVRYSAL